MPKQIDELHVFEVTADLFVRHGYAGTRTKDVADAAGVNEATLFRRYGSKAELLRRALDHQWRGVPLAGLSPSDDVEGDLVAIVEAYLETSRLRGAILPALLVELARGVELGQALGTAAGNVKGLVAILHHHQTAGRLRAESPLAALNALIGPLMVHEMFRRAGVGPTPRAPAPREHVRAFLVGRAGSAAESAHSVDRDSSTEGSP